MIIMFHHVNGIIWIEPRKDTLMMNNRQLADTFTLIANLSEIRGEVIYVILAYRKASENLMTLGREASEYWKEGKLREIPGVGKAIAEKIDELLTTGRLEFLE